MTLPLEALYAGIGLGPDGAFDPKKEAERILHERRFQEPDLPRPFRGPLEALADRIRELGGPLGRLLHALPGDGAVEWLFPAVAVAILAAVVATRLIRRRARRRGDRAIAPEGVKRVDADALETAAAEAEARGDLERALRLRFTAGLIRLDAADRIEFRPSLTTGDVARMLANRDFDDAARIFDEVVYGRREPAASDLEATRQSWERVLAGVGR